MQIKIYTIPILGGEKLIDELNVFLRSYKILQVEKQLVTLGVNAYWCFYVSFIGNDFPLSNERQRIDYKEVLDENAFKKFSAMREIRKKIAVEEAIPAYAVFTDEELATLAKMSEITFEGMKKVKGIGDKKVEKYGQYFVSKPDTHEKN